MPCLDAKACILTAITTTVTVQASLIDIFQEFREDTFDITGRSLFVRARVDTSALTGSGTERVLIQFGTLLEEQNGIGQNF